MLIGVLYISFQGDIFADPLLLIPQHADKMNLQQVYDIVSCYGQVYVF